MIYLDYNATAPARPEVVAVMQECLGVPLNPSSVHRQGREAKKYLENARKTIADVISAWPNEVIFCGLGTEANNWALRGVGGRRVLVSSVEHSSVLQARHPRERGELGPQGKLPEIPAQGGDDIIKVNTNGIVDLASLASMLAQGAPTLLSVMLANNETGVMQPIREVAEICKKHGALLHCDAVQALGKIPVDFGALGVDMMTISAHKCGGPLGAAALVVRRDLAIAPLLTGGGQELRRRAGTENVPAIVGFAKAAECIDFGHMARLRGWLDTMENVILSEVEGSKIPRQARDDMIIGATVPRLPNTSCIAMPGVTGEVQLMNFDLAGFAVSAGSACSSGRIEGSHVLAAMGVEKNLATSAIRVSGGWKTTEQEIISFTEAWKTLYQRLKKPVN